MKKILKLFIPTAFLLSFAACSVGNIDRSKVISAPRDYELTILHLGDTNGQVEGGQNSGIGYSRFSTILERARSEFGKESVLYLDSGNAFYGSKIAETDKGESIVKILNALSLDAITLGSNDFNYGEKNIKSLEMRANFKILAANIKKQDGQDFVTPYIIKNINGVKIGIFGLVSPDIYNNENALLDTITIDEPIVSATKIVKELKSQGAEFIIALTNLGMNNNTNREWQSSTLAESVSGIDLIVDGNSKIPSEEKIVINNTTIIQSGENLKDIGVLKIDFDAPKRDKDKIFYKLIKKEDIVMIDDSPMQMPMEKEKNSTGEKFITHTVAKGDTLYSLAKKYGTTVDAIVALNPTIEDGKTISIGQTYVMVSDKNSLGSKKLPNLKNNNSNYIEHTVVKGDTLYSLAKKYGTTVDAVVAVNPEITDGQNIKIGHTYKFPSKEIAYQETTISQENISNDFDEEVLSSQLPDTPENDMRVPASSGIAKDPKIETLIAKIKTAQSFMK
ncbi:LysM peptidoglycan-binding domain-containing protein [Fusobacterium sp.]|uniref:LysM peptidoglycan-binding domain-containing protein n=1 Tax=Fusobacterium sp. TaxID=68766 RepID=UPI002614AD5F|nr:LysM peptidoglycan-binding domain-containing protein [Fusobacterium sp.]